jgi:hypothetical protein
VNTLRITPHLENEVLRFFDEAGLSSGKVPILEQRLSAKLEEISRDSPILAEAFSNLHQLASAQLHSHKSEAATQQDLNSLRGDVGYLRNVLTQFKQAQEEMLKKLDGQSQRDIELSSLKTEVLRLSRELDETKHLLRDTRAFLKLDSTLPTFIYSYNSHHNEVCRTNLVTRDNSSHRLPLYQPKKLCCWSEVPGGSLLITGGLNGDVTTREVVSIDVQTFDETGSLTYEVSLQPPMLTPRREHAAVYHTQHLYVLGGVYEDTLSECERYVCAERRWEALPPLPRACIHTSGVVVENSLYALGGEIDGLPSDLVQKLSLESLTWELVQLRLPYPEIGIPCFKRNSEVYLIVNKYLCSFTALRIKRLERHLSKDIKS